MRDWEIREAAGRVPAVTAAQMAEIDRVMVEELGIELVQMMENAGRALAVLARVRFLGGDVRGRRVVVLAGTGGNGGGAMVAARRLAGWGAEVHVLLDEPPGWLEGVPGRQLAILERMGVPAGEQPPAWEPVLILDGLLGYGIAGAPRGRTASLIRWANAAPAPVLALDLPSGLDPDSGGMPDPVMVANATLTLALPKRGLLAPEARPVTGELYLADIGVPPATWERLGIEAPGLFARGDLLRLS